MKPIKPESVVRWLDELDGAAYALRVCWHGALVRGLSAALIAAGIAGLLFLGSTS